MRLKCKESWVFLWKQRKLMRLLSVMKRMITSENHRQQIRRINLSIATLNILIASQIACITQPRFTWIKIIKIRFHNELDNSTAVARLWKMRYRFSVDRDDARDKNWRGVLLCCAHACIYVWTFRKESSAKRKRTRLAACAAVAAFSAAGR